MPRLIYYVASSLDGYIADENGEVDWLPELDPHYDFGYAEFLAGIDALLMGRRTYEQVLTFGDWPYAGKPTRVWTRHPLEDPPPETGTIAGAPVEVARQLDADGFSRVWLVGGAELAEALRREGLIDEWIVALVPVTLGAGVPLFGGVQERLRIDRVQSHPGSIVQLFMSRES
jgi:dihydrofolate reductase